MLTLFKELRGKALHCEDGHGGRIEDVLFDDRDGEIRYLVAKVGRWPYSPRVLVSPIHLKHKNDELTPGQIEVALRREQLLALPTPETAPPVSRQSPSLQQLAEKASSFERGRRNRMARGGLRSKLGLSGSGAPSNDVTVFDLMLRNHHGNDSQAHLRSVREISQYTVEMEGCRTGFMEDVWLDLKTWRLVHLSFQSEKRHHLLAVPLALVRGISYGSGRIRLASAWDICGGGNRGGESLISSAY